MVKDYILEKKYAECYELKDVKQNNENCLRVWCNQYPDGFTFQIRTHKPITGHFGKGKPRNMIAHLTLTINEVKDILKHMEGRDSKDG